MDPYDRQHPKRMVRDHRPNDRQQSRSTASSPPHSTAGRTDGTLATRGMRCDRLGRARAMREPGCNRTNAPEGTHGRTFPAPFRPSPNRRWRAPKRSATAGKNEPETAVHSDPQTPGRPHRPAESQTAHCWVHSFPFQRFHVLFNSLFKVLFIFPSRYLFAIGLTPVFSFRWSLPPVLGCIPKQPDSSKAHRERPAAPQTGLSPSATCCSKQLRRARSAEKVLLATTTRRRKRRRFQIWAIPASLAVTGGILVSFFSSAY